MKEHNKHLLRLRSSAITCERELEMMLLKIALVRRGMKDELSYGEIPTPQQIKEYISI